MADEPSANGTPSVAPRPLPASALYRRADLAALPFATTADLAPLPGLAEQPRALDAIRLGLGIGQRGFNIFVIGLPGGRMQEPVRRLLQEAAAPAKAPSDWVYVANFSDPQRPTALDLPAGRAPEFERAIHTMREDLRGALAALFESDDYQKRRSSLEQSVRAKHEHAFASLNEKAQARGIGILRTPMGLALAPLRDGKIVQPSDFRAWPEEEQATIRTAIEELEGELEHTLRSIPRLEKELRDAVHALDRETAEGAVAPTFAQMKTQFADVPAVLRHVDAIRDDLLNNVENFVATESGGDDGSASAARVSRTLDRYEVNVLVSQADHGAGAPVVDELHPTLGNLIGRIEYLQVQGALVTNFRMIKAGALHRANGGAILLDARGLLSEPFSWMALKHTLVRGRIVIEDVARFVGLTTTASLEPDPIPLDVKVVLFGDRYLYYLLSALDPDVALHFKVLADFEDDLGRSPESEATLARLIGAIVTREQLDPLDREAVARAVEHAARLADDAARLALAPERLRDLIVEASHHAKAEAREVTTCADVEEAIAQQVRRASRLRERSQDMILRDIALIDTTGARVGQVNGLSVIGLGDYAFGRPTRITCRVRPGGGKIVDIEREVELGGPLHSKGVLILAGYVAGRYALDVAMSLSASLVFEQSYGGVEGDSASSAELYALLSALSGVPLRQDLAVTGSVNQQGLVQAIGGVNEKIEGFFDICAARGLTGAQGVLIPAANAQHLMLRADVVEACAQGRFAVYPVTSIDEGIALLTGTDAGERGPEGLFPSGSVNRLIEDRLRTFSRVRKDTGVPGNGGPA
jgi:lon-related putative ATP-dependent protease